MLIGRSEIKSMSRFLVIAAAALVAVGHASAQPETEVRDATLVVMRQLEAFRRGDFDTAYGFASEMIRARFDRQSFEQMVTTGYPEIARSVAAYVAETRVGPDDSLYLLVKIRGANGVAIDALYEMVRENGAFRINGVVTRPTGASAATQRSRTTSSRDESVSPPNRTRS